MNNKNDRIMYTLLEDLILNLFYRVPDLIKYVDVVSYKQTVLLIYCAWFQN
ncbi:hypothetical protein M153_18900011747 [Pseudoloma neurophilia]|uniref:Uncharacterized protein n=1 Tax=Pseudoloma neurophilia TaxID=146866 RepID=A0A0R0LZB1_9MICR|nr:hypothetical protein M153_18900011747 [Pseudoloma neurophilia]